MGEASGLVASWQKHGVGWMIRDSGKPASLYSLRFMNGRPIVREVKVLGADNTDWEDITYSVGKDGRGRLWIIESMQKGRDPFIYEIVEPDPYKATWVRLHMRHRFKYPGDGFQNTEASLRAAPVPGPQCPRGFRSRDRVGLHGEGSGQPPRGLRRQVAGLQQDDFPG
jgi:hypothetical protein